MDTAQVRKEKRGYALQESSKGKELAERTRWMDA